MAVQSLGYLGARFNRINKRRFFADRNPALQQADRGGRRLLIRVDVLVQRLIVSNEPVKSLSVIGWEVSNRRGLLKCRGRHRLNLPEPDNNPFLDMRLEAAGEGLHTPPPVEFPCPCDAPGRA